MRYRFKLYGRDFETTGPDGRPFSTATIAHVARLTRMLAMRSRSEPVRQQGADKISDTFFVRTVASRWLKIPRWTARPGAGAVNGDGEGCARAPLPAHIVSRRGIQRRKAGTLRPQRRRRGKTARMGG